MAENLYLNNQFLVAMPGLQDSHFTHSVALLCEHNEQGALGLVINRPTDLRLADMLEHMQLAHPALDSSPYIVHWGGPVQTERGFVVHSERGKWESSLKISDTIHITTSKDILSAIGRGEGPRQFLVALGYSGWAAGQLEHEIRGNSWLNTPVDRAILFDLPPTRRWQAATRLLGVEVTQLTAGPAGHA
ncbi:MAG: YqgE/AlgH family protein [Nevskiales bacterium]|nr:YqgE/AlgH family protein [Nevskiales bacterium]